MKELDIYKVDINYIAYLKSFDNDVCEPKDQNKMRPYIGVIALESEYFYYFAPLTSKTNKPDYYCIKIRNKNNIVIGGIRINNMIPIKKEYNNLFNRVDIKALMNSNDKYNVLYGNLLLQEFNYIRKEKVTKAIVTKAKYFYHNYKYNRSLQKLCCNFPLLEELAIRYKG